LPPRTDSDRVLALAGVFQAADLVKQVARRGLADAATLAATLGSVFVLDPPSVESVFGGPTNLARGLRVVHNQIGGRGAGSRDPEVTRYVVGILHLEGRLRRRPEVLRRIRDGLEAMLVDGRPPSPADPEVTRRLGELYVSTVSKVGPRVIVQGEPAILAQPEHAGRIRALLLAGIRAAVLWRQCGGSRLGLLLRRKRLAAIARDLLQSGTDPATPR
jgi:high frequency lysogenization protein